MDKKHYEQEHDIMEDNLLEPSVPKKPRVKWIIGAVLAVVLMASAAIAVISVLNKIKNKSEVDIQFSQASIQYLSFEEMVPYSDVIVKAKFLEVERERLYNNYYFTVSKVYHGEVYQKKILVKERRIHACVIGRHEVSFSTDDSKYKKNHEYYLFLGDRITPYSEIDTYAPFADGGYYPVSNPSDSTMYGESLLEHSKIPDKASLKSLENYLISLIETVSFVNESDNKFIHETDLETVVRKSDYVLEVTIDEDTGENVRHDTYDRVFYSCTVEDPIRGNNVKRGDKIIVILPSNKVKPGDRIVVAVFKLGENPESLHYFCSSRNSIIPINQKEAISKIISDLS
ncbi:MAG: hypothetical protein J6X34_01745 [Clostridia bacterium]|nr:hypothetical protein [Clostridia bacterium]